MTGDARFLERLQAKLDAMPPVRVMAVAAVQAGPQQLRLLAPLAANVNDKGCAFGGSLNGLMTLAAWSTLTLRLDRAGIGAEVYVANCQTRYVAPVYQDLVAEAELADDADWDAILARLRDHGRARADMVARVVMADGSPGAEMQARFAIIAATGAHA